MSDPAFVEIQASATEKKALHALRMLVDESPSDVTMSIGDNVVSLPQSLLRLVRFAADALGEGDTVALVSEQAEVTPAQAARLLGVSRQYVDRLIESGVLPARRLPRSSYRKIPVRAVLAHAVGRERKRAGITAVVEDAVAAGLDY
jgi:excisionase family DNA binding protein